jgi:hypothetical protein
LGAFPACGVDAAGGDPSDTATVTSEIVNGTHDYLFVQTLQPWLFARGFCHQVGHLVTIGSASENQFLTAQAAAHGGGYWWIGRSDMTTEGNWVWENNEFFNFYSNWAPGQPANVTGSEDFAALDATTGMWSALSVSSGAFYFICERDTGPAPAPLKFVYSGFNTSSDTQNFTLGFIPKTAAGHLVTVGTCGLPGATNIGDTFLRIFDSTNTTEMWSNDDACGGVGSNISFLVDPFTIFEESFVIHAGCWSNAPCSGTVMIRVE